MRSTKLTYLSGRIVRYEYNSGADDDLSRISFLADDASDVVLLRRPGVLLQRVCLRTTKDPTQLACVVNEMDGYAADGPPSLRVAGVRR